MVEVVQTADYGRNVDRARGDDYPCIVCGRPVKSKKRAMVHLHGGGSVVVTEAEAATMNESADMYFYPIGPDCLKKNPQYLPYVHYTIPD